MSSTNRGGTRNAMDYYVTPIPAVLEFLEGWAKANPEAGDLLRDERTIILDPCAGGNTTPTKWELKPAKDGKPAEIIDVPVLPMSYPSALLQFADDNKRVITNDIREDSPAEFAVDFCTAPTEQYLLKDETPDIIISNPPFALALPFIQRALEVVRPGGFVVMLQRLNFLGSKARRPFFKRGMPIEQFVHPDRLGFIPGKPNAKDSIEYSHFVWQRGNITDDMITRVL